METAGNSTDDTQTTGDGALEAEGAAPPEPGKSAAPPLTRWREIWPLPLLGVGAILFASGVYTAFSTAPDPVFTPALEDADRLIQTGAYEEAIGELNERVYPYVGRPELPRAAEGQYRVLLARAIYGGQRELEFPQAVNDENVIDQYLKAEQILGELSPGDIEKLARTYIARDEFDLARARAESLADPERSASLYRDVIDLGRRRANPDYTGLLSTVDTYLAMPGLSDADRVWGLARRAEMQIELGYESEAVDGLLREMPLLVGRDIAGIGELFVYLGRGYLEMGAGREALAELRRADSDALLPPEHPARAWGRLYLAQAIERTVADETELRAARDRFEALSVGVGPAEVRLRGLFGLARTESALEDHDASLEAFGALIAEMQERDAPERPTREAVEREIRSIAQRHESAWIAGGAAHRVGLMRRFAELGATLFQIDESPAPLLSLLSRAYEASARVDLGLGPETTGQRFSLDDLRSIDPSTLRQAKRHLIQAASYARLHADRFIIDDYSVYADSLWRSAMLSDAAGDRSQAIASLTLFAETVQNDARQPEACYRLGQLFQSRGEYKTAAGYYEGLIDESRADGASAAGQWADLSFVPLAQCYIADVDESNDANAVRLLEQSIDGTRGGPDRPEFLQAVIELGNLAARQGRYANAIERYDEAVARNADGPPMPMVRFKQADALRLLAGEIERRLEEPMSDRERGILSAERASHLRRAIEGFKGVRDEFERVDERTLSELQSTCLRNAYFYLGDCAFDLGQYDEAIEYYNMARARYPRDPAVLVALIQVVNAYLELGDVASARTANERAKAYHQTLPDSVWDDPNLPLTRREWERWLDANTRLYEGYAQGG